MDAEKHVGLLGPEQPHPPALSFRCPAAECGWTWHAQSGDGWQPALDRAWRRHLSEVNNVQQTLL